MERGRRVPDRAPRLEACYRAVIGGVRARPAAAGRRLFVGGKSMGGRIASQAVAGDAQAGRSPTVDGLVFLGYPLHPPGRPDKLRAAHLPSIAAPMLFVQGSRDAFGTPAELRPVLSRLRARRPPRRRGWRSLVPRSREGCAVRGRGARRTYRTP